MASALVQPSTPTHLLRAYLRADAPAREKLASLVMAGISLAIVPLALVMGPVQGWKLSIAICVAMVVMALWCLTVYEVLSRGWYHPAIPYLNVYFEVTLPFIPLLLFWWQRGSVNALTSPVYTGWGALVVFSAFRSDPRICIGAGVLAAVENGILYWIIRAPQITGVETITWPWAMQRSFYLLLAGVAGAGLARSVVKKAEDALRQVREQDLMGKYFLHERLGVGGMAEVFRATYCPEGGFQKTVALKRILPSLSARPHFSKLFLQEARLCALLNHPNVVQVFDCGRYQDTWILAMEFVDGLSLHRILSSRASGLPLDAVTYLGAELAAALDYLHQRIGEDGQPLGLVHRDVNPPNVLLSRFGEVKLADFGVAHAARSGAEGKGFVGKVSYAAPEQRAGGTMGPWTDLYALGLTLHEALTGVPVFGSEEGADEPSLRLPNLLPPSRSRSDVPPALDAIVMELLAPQPTLRPANGGEVRSRLLELRGAAAPFPHGLTALTRAIEDALEHAERRIAHPSGDRTQPLEPPPRITRRMV
jgi:serine/threonine-protein kinase